MVNSFGTKGAHRACEYMHKSARALFADRGKPGSD